MRQQQCLLKGFGIKLGYNADGFTFVFPIVCSAADKLHAIKCNIFCMTAMLFYQLALINPIKLYPKLVF